MSAKLRVGFDRFLICFPLRYGILVVCVVDTILLLTLFTFFMYPSIMSMLIGITDHCKL